MVVLCMDMVLQMALDVRYGQGRLVECELSPVGKSRYLNITAALGKRFLYSTNLSSGTPTRCQVTLVE